MPELAQIVITPTGGNALALDPVAGASGAEGIFMSKDDAESFFPVPEYDEEYAESIDTEGALRVRSRPQNATGSARVLVSASSEAGLATYLDRWQTTVEAVRRDGGTIQYTRPGSATTVTYDVLSLRTTAAPYDGILLRGWVQAFNFEFTCKPYARLAERDATIADVDPFARDTIGSGEWGPFDAGSGTLSVSGGQLVPSSTAEKRMYRYALSVVDGVEVFKITTGASVASGLAEVMAKRIDANNWLSAGVSFSGAASTLVIRKDDASTISALATGATFTTAPNTTYYVRLAVSGNDLTATIHAADPTGAAVAATPSLSAVSHTLTAGNATKYGSGVWGGVGLRATPQATDYRYDEWRVEALALRSTEPLFVFEVPRVAGHVDALADLTLAEISGQNRQHVEVGLEPGRTYDQTINPPNIIDSDQLATSGFSGTQTTRAGAFDPLAAGGSVVRGKLATITSAVCGTGPQYHVGTYRVKARVYAAGTGPAYVRLAWRDGDGQLARNKWVTIPTTLIGQWVEVDLDSVQVGQAAVAGTGKWEGQIEAYTGASAYAPGDTLDVDYVEMLGAGSYAKSRGSWSTGAPTVLSAADAFNQAGGGSLGGKSDDVGNVWAVESGAATNWSYDGTAHRLTRSTTSEAGYHFATIGSAVGPQAVQAATAMTYAFPINAVRVGVVARYVNTTNYLAAYVQADGTSPNPVFTLAVVEVVGGVSTVVWSAAPQTANYAPPLEFRLLVVGGLWELQTRNQLAAALNPGTEFLSVASGYRASLATGGALATGLAGITDKGNSGAVASSRYVLNFYAWPIPVTTPLFANRSARFRSSDAIREAAAGGSWGALPQYTGSRLKIPAAGPSGRVSRIAAKARRNDVETSADDQIADALQASLRYSPRVALLG